MLLLTDAKVVFPEPDLPNNRLYTPLLLLPQLITLLATLVDAFDIVMLHGKFRERVGVGGNFQRYQKERRKNLNKYKN